MRILGNNKLQSVDTVLHAPTVGMQSKYSGLYINNPSNVTLTYVISVVFTNGKQSIQGSGELKPGEIAQMFEDGDTITLVYGEKLQGKCNEATETLSWILYGENSTLNA